MKPPAPYPIKWHFRIAVKLIIALFKKVFHIKANVPKAVKNLQEPYLLLANHYGRYDPFIISDFLTKKPNFVSSDAILRDPFYGPLFSGLGAIPKKKGVRDTQVIRAMKKVIESGGAVALFPEGTRTWSGVTHPLDPSIGKLAKLLNVPLVLVKMKGAYAFDPRWAKPLRRASMQIDYTLVSKQQLAHLSHQEVMQLITSHLHHDDIAYAQEQNIIIKSARRAEYIDRMLFQCPSCQKFDGFTSHKNNFWCTSCGYNVYITPTGNFEHQGNPVAYANPRDWFNWQARNFVNYLSSCLKNKHTQPLFKARQMRIYESNANYQMMELGLATIYFFANHIEIAGSHFKRSLPHADISSLSPQFKERIELFFKNKAYRFSATQHQEPGVKWELAINTVWFHNGQPFKLSPYFKYLFE